MASSSLASQLANVRALNANRLTNARLAARAQATSYLFPPSIASTQDYDTLHGLAVNGWEELCAGDAAFDQWNDATKLGDLLFGDQSRDTDRLTLSKDDNATIDEAIADFLFLVGDNLLDRSAGKCVEWLVRRFRAHEYNVDALLAAFIAFHETQEFARLLRILSLKDKAHWAFLLPVQRKAVPLPASVLLSALLAPPTTTTSMVTLRWTMGLPQQRAGRPVRRFQRHRHVLFSFWLSTICKLCARWSGVGDVFIRMGLTKTGGKRKESRDDDMQLLLSIMLPAVLGVAQDPQASVFGSMAMCSLAAAVPLSADASKVTVSTLASVTPRSPTARTALVGACTCVLARQSSTFTSSLTESDYSAPHLVSPDTAVALMKLLGQGSAIPQDLDSLDIDPLFYHTGIGLVDAIVADHKSTKSCLEMLEWLLELHTGVSQGVVTAIVQYTFLQLHHDLPSSLLEIIAQLHQRKPQVIEAAYAEVSKVTTKDARTALEKVARILSIQNDATSLVRSETYSTPVEESASSNGKTKLTAKAKAALALESAQSISLDGAGVLGAGRPDDAPALALFVSLCANVSTSSDQSVVRLIGTLVARLGDASLVFLASVWSASDANGSLALEADARLVAIRYANAFLSSFASATGTIDNARLVDFQAIIPSFLVSLKDAEKRVRLEALAGIQLILQIASSIADLDNPVQHLEIFGYDTLYGPITAESLKYLDFVDVLMLLEMIIESRQGMINDANNLDNWMQASFTPSKDDGKPEKKFKAAVAHWLSSHVLCWSNEAARLSLLTALSGVRHDRKLTTLLPLIEGVVAHKVNMPESLTRLLFSTYDKSAKKIINEDSISCWTVFKQALVNPVPSVQRQASIVLRKQVFAILSKERQAEVTRLLAHTIVNATSPVPREMRDCLSTVRIDPDILVQVFGELRSTIAGVFLRTGPVHKKGRTEGAPQNEGLEATGTLVELLEANLSRKRSGETEASFVAELFEVLRLSTDMHLGGISVAEHLMQVCMGNLSNALRSMSASSTSAADVLEPMRIDVLINVVKTPCRPQTFQQALLLLSLIGKSAPDLVLQHSMPIFTFVGSTMLQRDDEYSFNVIDKTLQSIVPPVVADVRKRVTASKDSLPLLQASRDLLCVFTDAATHIPRHRRQSFFHLLATVMGQRDFKLAICMLLVDRQAFRVTKLQTDEEIQLLFALPLSLFAQAHEDVDTQLNGLGEVWDEAMRTWEHRLKDPIEMQEHVFLDCVHNIDSEHESRKMDPIKRITALIRFAKFAIRANRAALEEEREGELEDEAQRRDVVLQDVVQHALSLAHVDVAIVAEAAQDALDEVMTIVSVRTLEHVVVALLDNPDRASQLNGLQIFATSVEGMLNNERHRAASFTPRIIQLCGKIIGGKNAKATEEDCAVALETLHAIAANAVSSEHAALSDSLSSVAAIAQREGVSDIVSLQALELVRRLCEILGPRLIPKLVDLVSMCRSIIRECADEVDRQRAACAVINALFRSVPTFMSSHLASLFELCIAMPKVAELDAMRKALSIAPRFVAPSDFLQAVYTVYDKGDRNDAHMHVFCLDVVLMCERQIRRSKVLAQYKAMFRFLVSVFDARRMRIAAPKQYGGLADADVALIERKGVGVFTRLVFKLNETTFRPLFLRLCDWAIVDLSEEDDEEATAAKPQAQVEARQTVLYKILNSLLEELGELVSHYYVNVLDAAIEGLQRLALDGVQQGSGSAGLWESLMTSVKLSARLDKGAFWNQVRVNKIMPALTAQIGTSLVQSSATMERLLSDAIVGLCRTVSDEGCLKLTNNALLDIARNSAATTGSHPSQSHMRMRVVAVRTLERVWRAKDCEDGLLPLVPETVPSIAELLQESEDALQQAMAGLVGAIEAILGEGLDTYLQ